MELTHSIQGGSCEEKNPRLTSTHFFHKNRKNKSQNPIIIITSDSGSVCCKNSISNSNINYSAHSHRASQYIFNTFLILTFSIVLSHFTPFGECKATWAGTTGTGTGTGTGNSAKAATIQFRDDVPQKDDSDALQVQVIPCGGTKEFKINESAYIESPNFSHSSNLQRDGNGDSRTGSMQCNWRFLFSGCRLAISCPNFRLNDLLCLDYLEVRSSTGKKRRYCGGKGPKNLEFDDEAAEVTYRTNGLFNSLGFRCRIVCDDSNGGGADEPAAPTIMAPPINCECGLAPFNTKIVDGEETLVNEFPWMAGLVRKGGNTPFCGGSLINNKYVLTAAHCVSGRTPSNLEIILNEHNTQSGTETKLPVVRRSVELIIQHKSYSSRLDYDAALIKLRTNLDEEIEAGTVIPVCLPSTERLRETYAGEVVTVTGWGVISEAGQLSSFLRKANVTVMTELDCFKSYPGSITQRMMCAAAPGKDACQGDSGGPLIHGNYEEQKYTQVGVVSWGHGCARPNKPGVYSRVTEFMPWILRLAGDGSFCNA